MKQNNIKDQLARDIETAFEELIGVISGLGAEAFNVQPFPGSWTAGQTAEHIIICGRGIPDRNTRTAGRDFDQKVESIEKLFSDFNKKFKTDPSLAPGHGPHDRERTIHELKSIINKLSSIAADRDLEALCTDMEFPTFGYLTRYEWLKFIVAHTKRHTRQIKNIAAHLQNRDCASSTLI